MFEASAIVEGSPLRALNIEPSFDRYLFIDANQKNIDSLTGIVATHPNGSKAVVRTGDANERLCNFCNWLKTQDDARAVVFLDPFGLAVKWETILRLADTKKVDLWYLVPVDGMNRQIKSNGDFLPGAARIDDVWGSDHWRQLAVRTIPTSDDLFGAIDDRLEKIAKAKQFSEMFRDHLKEAFDGRVADAYLSLGKGNRHEFSLMFACANPSPAAFGVALRIANHILRTA